MCAFRNLCTRALYTRRGFSTSVLFIVLVVLMVLVVLVVLVNVVPVVLYVCVYTLSYRMVHLHSSSVADLGGDPGVQWNPLLAGYYVITKVSS